MDTTRMIIYFDQKRKIKWNKKKLRGLIKSRLFNFDQLPLAVMLSAAES